MSATQQTLAQLVRATNPGAYNDLSDTDLEAKVLAKYPQYSDIPRTSTASQARSATPGKALVTGPDGTPMFMDVPPGHEASTEAANQKGQAIGTAVGGGLVAGAGLAGAALAPTVATETVGTGILDAAGNEIMREGLKYGPSALRAALAHPLGQQVLKWAVAGGAGAIGSGTVWKALKLLGVIGKTE